MTQPEEKLIVRVQKLLDQASHPNTGEDEARVFLAKADELMVKHSIDAALLASLQTKEEREKPERRDVQFFDPSNALRGELGEILAILAELADVKVVRLSATSQHAAVGFTADIDYLEVLFTSVRVQFQSKMFPTWDPDGDLDMNIYNFKVAGYKWIDIWREGATKHRTPMPFTPPPKDGGAMIRAYKRHAAKIGDTRKISTQRHDAYRKSYKAGFVNTLWDRVQKMTYSRRATEAASGNGAEVALRDRRQDVLEALYAEFPYLRPKSPEELRQARERALAAEKAQQEEFERWFAGLTQKQREKYWREQEAKERRYARYSAEWERRNRSDAQGYNAGSTAAATTDLSGGRNTVGGNKRELG